MPIGEFVGGALNFKGDKSKIKKKKRRVKHEVPGTTTVTTPHHHQTTETTGIDEVNSTTTILDDGLTEVERKALRRRLERERLDAEKIAQKSHRERIEEFNSKLASQTELNDIPRVSAAGNG
jgi:protein FAM32A